MFPLSEPKGGAGQGGTLDYSVLRRFSTNTVRTDWAVLGVWVHALEMFWSASPTYGCLRQ